MIMRVRQEHTNSRGRQHAVALLGACLIAHPAIAAPNGDATIGKTAYQGKCGGCHSVDMNRIGPLHNGVVGRKPGAVPGYSYSAAIKKLGGVWTPARLDLWLQNTQKVAPGSKMYFSVSDPVERGNIIAYLQSISPPAQKHK